MAITITGTLIVDETLGTQDNDVLAGLGALITGVSAFDTLLNAVVVQDLTGVNVTVAVSNGSSADLDGSSMLSGFGADVTDLAFTNSSGGPLLGEEAQSAPGVPLLTVDGTKIFLYSYTGADLGIDENNVVFGRKGVWNGSEYVADPSGDVVFAAYLQPTDASGAVQASDLNAVGSKVWLVQYEEIKHPITTNPDDALSLFNLHVTVSNRSDFSLQGAPSGQNLFLMYGDGTPSATDTVIIVTGKNPINQSSDPSAITSGDTVNTGQGGGPTTLGTNSQQIVEGTGLYFTFATGANPNFTVPNLDQNEADVEANIAFTELYGTNGASFSVVQSASGDKSTLEISAYTTPFNPGTAFIDNLHNNTLVEVTKVTITTPPSGNGKKAVPGETLVFDKGSIGTTPTTLSGITVTFSGKTVEIKGLEANDLIAYNTNGLHNRVLIDNIGSTDTNFDAPFDIGGFALVNSNVTPNQFSALTFHDDGPSADVADGGGAVTIDETAGNQDNDSDAAAVLALFDTEVTNKGTDLSPAEFAISTTPLATTALSSFGQDQEGATKVLSLAIEGGDGTDSLLDTTDGKNIKLFKEGNLIVGRYDVANGTVTGDDPAAFAIALLQDGNVAVAQYVSLTHPIAGNSAAAHDDRINLAGLVNAVVTVTDGDGDSSTDSFGIGDDINFDDDGPSADVADGGGAVTIDETAGNQDNDSDAAAVLALFDTEVTNKGTDLSPAEFAISTTPLATTALSSFGQDQEGATKVLSLAIEGGDGTDSLLDTTDGKNIKLFKEGNLIVGRYDVANGTVTGDDPAAFAIALLQDGNVAVAQYVSLTHPIAGSSAAAHDDRVNLAGLVNAVVTVTDGDGDSSTDSFGIGDDINFDDDGPTVSANNTVLLDDDVLTGGNPGGTGDDADSANVSGTLGHAFGQDGAGTVAYLTSGAPTGFTYVADGTSLLVKQGTTTVLTLTMVAASGAYTVVQNNPILHAAGLTENNQVFTINYRVTDGDGDTADGTLSINVDDDTPVVTAKSNLVYANTSNEPPATDVGGAGVFAYAIGADKHTGIYSALNSDFLSVSLTGVTVGANAITNKVVSWASETDSQAEFNVGFTYVSNPVQQTTTNATGTLTFNKVAGTYTLKLDQEIESFSILNTSTPGNPLQGYALNSATPVGSNPPVSVMTLASNFFVQFEGFGVINGTPQTFAYDTVAGLFSNDRRYVTVSSASIGAASDTLQSDEVIDLDFFTENPKGFATSADPDNPVNPRATSKAIFIEFTQAGPGAGKDMLVVLKLVDDITGATINRTFIVGNSTGNDDVFNANLPAYGFVAKAQNGIVVFESNDYNFDLGGGVFENHSIQGAQVVTSTQGVSGTGYQLNGAIDDPATPGGEGATTNAQIAFGGDTTEGNNEPIKIVNIGFVASTTPDAHLTFDVVLADADGDATATQTLDVTIVGGDDVTASANADTFVIGDADVDGLLSMIMTVIDGGFASGIDRFDFTAAGSGTNYTEVLAPVTNLAAFTAAADAALNGTTQYYFGVVGGNGYLAQDIDGAGITNIIQLVGVNNMASTDIV
ncbi:beta strand repeat-containing protein [Pseudomonas sp. TCU-HL1]|uniref:beta strand repeat-containing protein n=1 Tax=Pseudomonas sp. TCU-HL1 TaxID=1856685 RepID=UPI00083E498A|nr:DUF5801 repeats-in-toxin domain-containing protein [Pseudomonas sp. TCU-HL1]AOE87526.1 hypothetical protein THL1_4978 [Pseudomonas sp. TCU-HL1]